MEYTTRYGKVIEESELYRLERKMTELELASHFGLSPMGLRKIRGKMGWPKKYRRKTGPKKKYTSEELRLKYNAYHREYRKRKGITGNSYNGIRVGDKVVRLSRHKVAIVLNRNLKPEEVVHHIDGNRRNDRYDNLMVFGSQKDHLDFHKGKKVNPLFDPRGKKFFTELEDLK